MDNLTAVEVVETRENLTGEIGQRGFIGHVHAFKGSTVHVLKKDLDLTGMIGHVMTLDDVKVIDTTQDLNFTTDLTAYIIVVVSIDDFECKESGGGTMEHLVDCTTAAAADSIDAIELGEVEGLGGGGGGWERKWKGYVGLALGQG